MLKLEIGKIYDIMYHDHHTMQLSPMQVLEVEPKCINRDIGELVYQDNDWVRIEWSITDMGGDNEIHETCNIRRVDIVTARLVGEGSKSAVGE